MGWGIAGMVAGLVLLAAPVTAQDARAQEAGAQDVGPSQAQLDKAVHFGGIAAISPICGLRNDRWATDLRLAEMQAMGAPPRPDPSDARGQTLANKAGAALSYAEDEALEDFVDKPRATCTRLQGSTDLKEADDLVATYRAGKGVPMW